VWLGRLLVLAVSVVLVTGTVVTGAGPHSGDAGPDSDLRATRLDLAVPDVARVHGTSVMVFLALVLVALFVLARRPGAHRPVQRIGLLLGLVVAQAGLGYYQYFNGVPRVLVGFHVAGATAVFAATMAVLLAMYEPVRRRPGLPGAEAAFNSEAPEADKGPWSVAPTAPVASSRAWPPPSS
jgi:cytochrome c oxidase assembly protein subunit 15